MSNKLRPGSHASSPGERRNRREGPRKTQVSGEVCHQSTRNGKTKAVDSGAKIGSTTKKKKQAQSQPGRPRSGGGREDSRTLGPPFFAPAPTTGTSGQLHRPGHPPGPPPAMPARTAPWGTHMGSRVLLSQDLRASKFSMIILETIHRGPEAGHTPALAQVAAAAAAAPSSARRPSAWAAVGGAGGGSPRAELA